MGTWIETHMSYVFSPFHRVVPLVGTWIETERMQERQQRTESFPSWERGLKRLYGYSEDDTILVVPLAETCIETRRSPRGNVY